VVAPLLGDGERGGAAERHDPHGGEQARPAGQQQRQQRHGRDAGTDDGLVDERGEGADADGDREHSGGAWPRTDRSEGRGPHRAGRRARRGCVTSDTDTCRSTPREGDQEQAQEGAERGGEQSAVDDALRGERQRDPHRPGAVRSHQPAVGVAVDELRRPESGRVPTGAVALAEHEPERARSLHLHGHARPALVHDADERVAVDSGHPTGGCGRGRGAVRGRRQDETVDVEPGRRSERGAQLVAARR